jgi:hypothetical protein
VTSASFSGQVDEPIRIGPIRSSARVAILVELSTQAPGGYRAARELAGRTVIDYCPDPNGPDCTAVASSVYDAGSGWVRANGPVCAVWHSLQTVAYTPLGQARFEELDSDRGTRTALGQPRLERRSARSTGDALAC